MPTRAKTQTLVVGAGTAGLVAFKALQRASHSSLLYDGGPLGTTCARVGCMPSKALIELAKKAHHTCQMADSRILAVDSHPQFDLVRVLQNVRKLRDYFTNLNIKGIEKFGDQFVAENIEFVSEHRAISSKGDSIEFENALLTVGSSPRVPSSFADQKDVFTSDSIFDLDRPLESLEVIGCGPVGLELAQAFSRFGVQVRLYCEEFKLKMLKDADLHAIFEEGLRKDIGIITGVEVFHSGRRNELEIGPESRSFDACLLAVGRKSNIEGLNIPIEPLEYDHSGVRIKNSHFYIAGDASERASLVHEAEMEGRRAAKIILGEDPIQEPQTRIQILFTDPQVAVVERRDLEEKPLKEEFIDLSSQGRLTLAQENHGAIKLYMDPHSNVILKACIVSTQAEHLAHFIFNYIEHGKTYKELKHSTFYHPSIYQSFRIQPQSKESIMPKHRSGIDHSQNPSDKIQDIGMEHFEKNTGRKIDHETLNRHSRADVLDRNTKNRARDSI